MFWDPSDYGYIGNEPLLLPSKFLAMEWRNNPKDIDHVEITLKDHMVCVYVCVSVCVCVSVLLSMTIMTTLGIVIVCLVYHNLVIVIILGLLKGF